MVQVQRRTGARRRAPRFEAAVPAGEDPARYARLLRQVREATLAGARPPAAPRPVIGDSWQRTLSFGIDPEQGKDVPGHVRIDEVEHRRHGSKLDRVLPVLGGVLLPAAEDAGHIMVVVDCDGVVLWRDGPRAVQRNAERLGFCPGANWAEQAVGTNAIGTALVVRHAVQVYSAEHFVKSHHSWTCAAAPIHDPASGELLGVVDVSGAAATVHPSTLALIDAAARMAEASLRSDHRRGLEELRATAAPVLARVRGPAFACDRDGWVAGAAGVAPVPRIALPRQRDSQDAWLPSFGRCRLEPLPGGLLVTLVGDGADGGWPAAGATTAELDLRDPRFPALAVTSPSGHWQHRLSPRHAELLLILATAGDGRSAAELSRDMFGTPEHTAAIRAEVSRLRKITGGLLLQRPYRLADWVSVRIRYPATAQDILPASTAPPVRALRTGAAGPLAGHDLS
ncbi:MAG TPA: GAF domain-containing protein [Trebonia sp.]|nr:GAF domain-containing protein [Trebonia sp.]